MSKFFAGLLAVIGVVGSLIWVILFSPPGLFVTNLLLLLIASSVGGAATVANAQLATARAAAEQARATNEQILAILSEAHADQIDVRRARLQAEADAKKAADLARYQAFLDAKTRTGAAPPS